MNKQTLVARIETVYNEDLYKVIDYLNKKCKKNNIIIGLSLKESGTAVIKFYEG
ncbi:hypothetical protein MJ3_01657 [Salimicrobium jeotgali]|uniref:DUF4264 domain-containing protein n=1 Tax=Salimicrobium jeotgali TaxID=1230341 RepID=K2GC74_9BACI|nr:DUF4264 family protein [Salimicrobium jeotgali]EKE32623.1 hypothetical protein MJ3_01657 [Salimicrobium jeotgali]MBM7695394.1 hypothetical protein [Salimicrobium jeotgali]